MQKIITLVRFALVGVVLVGLAACAPSAPPKKDRMFWPALPDQPRFELLGNYYTENDFDRVGFEKTLAMVVGEAPDSMMLLPFDVVADSKGTVYVSDPGAKMVKKFNFEKRSAGYMRLNPSLQTPYGLAVDSNDNLYVVDGYRKEVLVYTPTEQYLRRYGSKEIFVNPTHLAIDEERNRLYVSDIKRNMVEVFDLQTTEHLSTIGKDVNGDYIMYGPQGLDVDGDGTLFVCDMLNARIAKFSPEGDFLGTFGSLGDTIYNFEFPKDLAIDSDGNVHIVDVRKAGMLSYRADGRFLLYTGTARRTVKSFGFLMPSGIWIDDDDKVYIADQLARRFGVWQYFNDSVIRENPVGGGSGYWQ